MQNSFRQNTLSSSTPTRTWGVFTESLIEPRPFSGFWPCFFISSGLPGGGAVEGVEWDNSSHASRDAESRSLFIPHEAKWENLCSWADPLRVSGRKSRFLFRGRELVQGASLGKSSFRMSNLEVSSKTLDEDCVTGLRKNSSGWRSWWLGGRLGALT